MLNYTIGDRRVKIPISWDEVNVDQFLKIQNQAKDGDPIAAIAILCNLPYDYVFNLKVNEADFDNFAKALNWFYDDLPDFKTLPLPGSLKINEKDYKIPDDLTAGTLGQKIVFEQKVIASIEATGDTTAIIDEVLAIYFYPAVTGKPFDPEDLEETRKAIRNCSIMQAYPIAYFFLTNLLKYSKLKKQPS